MSKESTSTFYMRKANGHETFQPPKLVIVPKPNQPVQKSIQSSLLIRMNRQRAAITYYIRVSTWRLHQALTYAYLDDSIGRKFKDVLRIENIADGTNQSRGPHKWRPRIERQRTGTDQISLAVMVYLKLSGSRLSRRPLASSTWGYIRKPSSGPLELGNLTS
jgi:hypothetical protein